MRPQLQKTEKSGVSVYPIFSKPFSPSLAGLSSICSPINCLSQQLLLYKLRGDKRE